MIFEDEDNSPDRATRYCSHCPKLCRFSCPASEAENRETSTPWAMMRLYELVKQGAVEPSDEVAEALYHCTGCRRCQTWCEHDNDVPEALWEARAVLRDNGYFPEQLDDFPGRFLDQGSPHGSPPPLDRIEPTPLYDVFEEEADTVYLPDCEVRYHFPERIYQMGRLFQYLGEPVALHTKQSSQDYGCCGFPLLSAGCDSSFDYYQRELAGSLEPYDRIISECSASVALQREETSWGATDCEINTQHLIEWLADRVDSVSAPNRVELDKYALHDACFTGRQLELYDESRQVLDAIGYGSVTELEYSRQQARCCGGASHYHLIAPEASEKSARACVRDVPEDKDGLITTSSTCRKAMERVDTSLDISTPLELVIEAFRLNKSS